MTSVVAISFSLTFVGVSMALLMGVLPQKFAALAMPVDLGVMLLMVPVCALVLAMLAEVLGAALRSPPRTTAPKSPLLPIAGRPGRGEG